MDICSHALLVVLTVSCKRRRQLAVRGGYKKMPVLDTRGCSLKKIRFEALKTQKSATFFKQTINHTLI